MPGRSAGLRNPAGGLDRNKLTAFLSMFWRAVRMASSSSTTWRSSRPPGWMRPHVLSSHSMAAARGSGFLLNLRPAIAPGLSMAVHFVSLSASGSLRILARAGSALLLFIFPRAMITESVAAPAALSSGESTYGTRNPSLLNVTDEPAVRLTLSFGFIRKLVFWAIVPL